MNQVGVFGRVHDQRHDNVVSHFLTDHLTQRSDTELPEAYAIPEGICLRVDGIMGRG